MHTVLSTLNIFRIQIKKSSEAKSSRDFAHIRITHRHIRDSNSTLLLHPTPRMQFLYYSASWYHISLWQCEPFTRIRADSFLSTVRHGGIDPTHRLRLG